jgi:hypothetical protein
MNRRLGTVAFGALLTALGIVTDASAGGTAHKPPPAHGAPTPPARAPDKPKDLSHLRESDFEIEKDGHDEEMRIKGIGTPSVDGYISYAHATGPDGKPLVSIHSIRGVVGVKGVGEALKKELLRRYPKRDVTSTLVETNAVKLLEAWAKGYPHAANAHDGESLRDAVPAMKWEGFDYEITAEPSSTGHAGSIKLLMKAVDEGKGAIKVMNPADLDKVLLRSPQRPRIAAPDNPPTSHPAPHPSTRH